MRRIVRVAAVALLPLLAGCATPVPLRDILDSWVGQPERELVAQLGVPRRTHENADGSRVLEYVRYWSDTREYPCEVRFVVSHDGIVAEYDYAGVRVAYYGDSCAAPLGESAFTRRQMHPSVRPQGR